MLKNVLITSIGAKIPLLQAVKKAANKFDRSIEVIGADVDENCIASFFTSSFLQLQKLEELNLEQFIQNCHNLQIKYIIPTRDADVVYFALHKKRLEQEKIFTFVCDSEVALLCFDKLKFYKQNYTYDVIEASLNIEELKGESFVVKERFGNSSQYLLLDSTKKECQRFAMSLKNPIFQPYIQGREFSVDAYVNLQGECVACLARSRELVANGESKISSYIKNKILESKIKKFVEANNIYGHSITQVIKQKDDYFIIECNTRFGGASTLSLAMGMDSFYWFLQETNHQDIRFTLNDKRLKQVRFSKDMLIEY